MNKGKPLEIYENHYGCWVDVAHKENGNNGYKHFVRNGKRWYLHRYMYQKYYGEIPKGMLVCHTCDNRQCINPKHLFLGTYKKNMEDAKNKGRNVRGEKSGRSKLTEKQVKEIRQSTEIHLKISKQYDISLCQVSLIRNRLSWAWLK